ncbi:hypothetical protein, partial [uncultured Marinobacter sp.]|uniref:hypothetical protein n=1 Tax=uncultured Marinobacter sp. TaxID=187379 RepID=UPI0030D83462
ADSGWDDLLDFESSAPDQTARARDQIIQLMTDAWIRESGSVYSPNYNIAGIPGALDQMIARGATVNDLFDFLSTQQEVLYQNILNQSFGPTTTVQRADPDNPQLVVGEDGITYVVGDITERSVSELAIGSSRNLPPVVYGETNEQHAVARPTDTGLGVQEGPPPEYDPKTGIRIIYGGGQPDVNEAWEVWESINAYERGQTWRNDFWQWYWVEWPRHYQWRDPGLYGLSGTMPIPEDDTPPVMWNAPGRQSTGSYWDDL